jgi:hypothetical protein
MSKNFMIFYDFFSKSRMGNPEYTNTQDDDKQKKKQKKQHHTENLTVREEIKNLRKK